jgi:hypothetical protein
MDVKLFLALRKWQGEESVAEGWNKNCIVWTVVICTLHVFFVLLIKLRKIGLVRRVGHNG